MPPRGRCSDSIGPIKRPISPACQPHGEISSPDPNIGVSLHIGVEASRGCPYDCEFCCSALTSGQQYRVRPVREVIAEIESIDASRFFFVDDALGLNREAGKKLFTDMIPLKRQWMGQGTVSLAEDVELLKLMRRSGCQGLLLGFESVQKDTQHEMKKIKNLKIDFYEAMRRFHGEGYQHPRRLCFWLRLRKQGCVRPDL